MPYQSDIPQPKTWFRYGVYPIFWLLSLLPLPLLYLLSSAIYILLYRIFGYRKKVVRTNLQRSFPEKSTIELLQIEKQFFKHLSDLFVEVIKGLSISKQELCKRLVYENPQILHDLNNENKPCVVVLTHSGNWEWIALASQLYVDQTVLITYKTISDSNFDYLMYKMRSRFLGTPVHMNETLRAISKFNAQNEPYILALIGDQSPSNLNGVHWEEFLNQETAFLNGPAKIAKKYNIPLIYLEQRKVKRGFYRARFTHVLDVEKLDHTKLMSKCIHEMQNEIKKQPFTWLWSHRRWKHQRH